MATEAQKLIGLSLAKIAQSRMNRGGISLHKNLLVATVLQKARFIFMEEAYAASYASEVSAPPAPPPSDAQTQQRLQPSPVDCDELERESRVQKRRRDSECEASVVVVKRCCGEERLEASAAPPPPPPTIGAGVSDRLRPPSGAVLSSEPCNVDDCEEPMEVDRITSLVSVFSFGANSSVEPLVRLGRSVSTPDFCSAQAKELEGIQRRTALAMTV